MLHSPRRLRATRFSISNNSAEIALGITTETSRIRVNQANLIIQNTAFYIKIYLTIFIVRALHLIINKNAFVMLEFIFELVKVRV